MSGKSQRIKGFFIEPKKGNKKFKLVTDFAPSGDQPKAIAELVANFKANRLSKKAIKRDAADSSVIIKKK